MRKRTYADLLLDGLIVILLLVGLLLSLAILRVPMLGPPADPLIPLTASPPWYFLPFYFVLQTFAPNQGLFILLAFFVLLFAVPLFGRLRRPRRTHVRLLGLLVCALLIWLVRVAVGQENPDASCLVCHSEIKVDYLESVHAVFDVDCVACHGGDSSTLDLERAHDRTLGFRGVPSRDQIPQLCSSCHADPVRMKPYGLRTDQFAEYLTSKHGQRWKEGDPNVAICTDCHTAHRILPAYEPQSSINRQSVPDTCARCHSNAILMEPYGLAVDQAEAFKRGVHGVALLEQGNMKAPNCATCHGTHGAIPPGVEDITKVCGTCHINERRYFNASLHKKAMDEQKISECASCHGNHEVAPADTGRPLYATCNLCHLPDSKAVTLAEKLKVLLVGAQQAVEEAEAALIEAEAQAYEVSPYRSRMIEARAYLIEALPVQHSLDVAQIEELTRRARSISEDVRSQVHGLLSVRSLRLVGLALIWGYLVLTLIVILLYRRERRRG
ncbi:MAG: hypothetical protein A2Z21_07920 [Candidatus Fraserbacteria bacterium RBG_16_55_9]|uniref:Cytochrome b/b6 C-terminal region profile domain-containing protein n=1 Tax=Fraserbacteria sp. (strain RBG_16_55_9) TaxID=1817864 RepID=A0A1F5UQE3_FRAXR|nr:MAG: hypothetical protein A2Z21_07920 [Candidatus Fraserbacteria bacterium RBG_16_55_9]